MSFSRWLWSAVPLIGIIELLAHYYFSMAPPSPSDWWTIEKPVRALAQPEDLVVVAPYWAEPNARLVFGDTLMPLEDVARADDAHYARAIELSILGEEVRLPGWREVERQEHGKFRLRVLENPAPQRVYTDFIDRLGPKTAEVFTRKKRTERPCDWNPRARVSNGALHGHPTYPRQRFECSRREWHFVGVTAIEDQNYRPRRCIWAHPDGSAETVIRFPEVELQNTIRGFGGLSYFLERESKGAPVTLNVLVDGEPAGSYEHRDGEGWTGFEFTTASRKGQVKPVEFRISTTRARQREFCFYASIR